MSSTIVISSANVQRLRRLGASLALLLLCLCLLWPGTGWSTRPQEEAEPEAATSEGEILLERWQPEAARQWVESRLANEPHHPAWRFLHGQALFELGRYAEALDTFEKLLKVAPHARVQAYRDFVAQTIQSIASLQPLETAHFHILLDPVKDAALVPYVGDVLEQSYQRLGTLLQWSPSEKIRVEIFPSTATFYPASSLSARDIEVSGAIGICKFNKIMLLSPRNLARGYRWTDALSHEYLHYVIVHLSHNHAPIWVHEGMAKYLESAWRLPQNDWLDRRTESLLAHALKHDSFVGFRKMDPSLVKLDTTYQVQLAYAEAASAIDFIVQQRGYAGLVQILHAMRSSSAEAGAAEAIAQVMGLSFDAFQAQWRQFLSAKQLQEHPGMQLPRFDLKQEGKMPTDEVQKELQSGTARMHARLGDRLRQSGRGAAAAAEYRRALEQDPHSPYLLNKLALTFMAQEAWPQALPYLQRAQQLSSDDAATYTNLGRLYVALRDYEQARVALSEAIQLNPYDPAIHLHLAEAYRQLGQAEKAQQEQQLFETLQRTP